MDFTVSEFAPTTGKEGTKRSQVKETKPIPKYKQDGIKVSKFGRHPDCPWEGCGLTDGGKEALVRPDEKHVISCSHRRLGPKPFSEVNGLRSERVGDFNHEMAPRTLSYPVRLIRQMPDKNENGVPILDENGKPKTRFGCSYKTKNNENCFDWFWKPDDSAAKGHWAPFWEANHDDNLKPAKEPLNISAQQKAWLGMFIRDRSKNF